MEPGNGERDWTVESYHEAENDIRWAKERSSRVTYWSVLLSGAVVASTKVPALPWQLLGLLTVVQLSAAVLWLLDLHTFAQKARTFVHGTGAPYPKAQDDDQHHRLQLCVQVGIVIVAALVALVSQYARDGYVG
jgi:hypothetical protein